MSPGIWQIVIVALLVLLLFGRGKISGLMGDIAKGITSFRKGLKEGGEPEEPKQVASQKTIEGESVKMDTKSKAEKTDA